MKYRVVFQRRAEMQFHQAAIWWAENRSPEQAAKWVEEFRAAIDGLQDNPQRHAYARENDYHPIELRQLLFGIGHRHTHRAIFYISDDTVQVVSVRHIAQRNLIPNEVA